MRTRHLNSKGCLHLIPGRETLDEGERCVDTDLADTAARKLSGRLQLVQRSSHEITGGSSQSFL
jgi:hypothetical protein